MPDILQLQEMIEKFAPWIIIIGVPFLFWKVPVWKTKIESDIENIKEKIKGLESKYEKIYDILVGIAGEPLVKRTSPLTLTDFGNEISEQIGAADIAKIYAEKLSANTKNLNAYQVQEYCFHYCEEKLLDDLKENNPSQYESIHAAAFDNGMEIEKITRVVGIKLRDAIFSITGTPHSDIDQRSP